MSIKISSQSEYLQLRKVVRIEGEPMSVKKSDFLWLTVRSSYENEYLQL